MVRELFLYNFSTYKYALFTKHSLCFVIFMASMICDAASTIHFMKVLGAEIESNIIVKELALFYGLTVGPILGKLYQLFSLWAFTVITPRLTVFVTLIISGINFGAAYVNVSITP